MIESDLEAQCRAHVKWLGGRFVKWTSPGTRGVPDRILLLPGLAPVFVELKNPSVSTVLKLAQRRWKKWLQQNGFEHWTINDYDVFVESVEEYRRRVS